MTKALTRGCLLAFEGIDGAGKTTQAKLLGDYLRELGLEVVMSKEPTQGPWGQKLRASKTTERMSPAEELDCFLKDRKEHVDELIEPALARGAVVIVDRYYYSTVAYQGARGMDPQALLQQNREFAPKPHLLVLMDLEVETGLKRIHKRGEGQDLFETIENLTKVRQIFQSLDEDHILHLDSNHSIEALHVLIKERLLKDCDQIRQLNLEKQ